MATGDFLTFKFIIMEKQFQTPEQWANDAFAELAFKGQFQLYRNLTYLMLKTTAASFLVFFRHNFGSRTLSFSTILWGSVVVSLFLLKEIFGLATRRITLYEGNTEGATDSLTLFWLHILVFAGLTVYHIYESRKNLRRTDGNEEIRYGQDTGLSLFYPFVSNLLKPFGFVYDGTGKRRWYHLDEYKFQKWIEPLALLMIGIFFKVIGFGTYGSYFVFGAFCIYLMISMEEEKYLEFKQNHWDSKFAAGLMTEINDPGKSTNRRSGMVVQQALMRSDGDFLKWKEQKEENPLFDNVPPVNNVVKNPHSAVQIGH